MNQLKGKEKTQLYSLVVKSKDARGIERELRVGPMLQFKSILEEQAATINKAVSEGRERTWRDAHVVKVERIIQ